MACFVISKLKKSIIVEKYFSSILILIYYRFAIEDQILLVIKIVKERFALIFMPKYSTLNLDN